MWISDLAIVVGVIAVVVLAIVGIVWIDTVYTRDVLWTRGVERRPTGHRSATDRPQP